MATSLDEDDRLAAFLTAEQNSDEAEAAFYRQIMRVFEDEDVFPEASPTRAREGRAARP